MRGRWFWLVAGVVVVLAASTGVGWADGTASGTGTFHDPTNACGNPATFTAPFQVTVANGTITIVQLNNNATVSGPIQPDGSFSASGGGRTYTGRIAGTMLQAAHTFDNGTCVARYSFDLPLSGAIGPAPAPTTTQAPSTTVPSSTASPATKPPEAAAPNSTSSESSSSKSWLWGGLVTIGVVAIGIGIALFTRSRASSAPAAPAAATDCSQLERAWKEASDKARLAANAAYMAKLHATYVQEECERLRAAFAKQWQEQQDYKAGSEARDRRETSKAWESAFNPFAGIGDDEPAPPAPAFDPDLQSRMDQVCGEVPAAKKAAEDAATAEATAEKEADAAWKAWQDCRRRALAAGG